MSLIILGRPGHARIARSLFGSTRDRATEHGRCTVLIVK